MQSFVKPSFLIKTRIETTKQPATMETEDGPRFGAFVYTFLQISPNWTSTKRSSRVPRDRSIDHSRGQHGCGRTGLVSFFSRFLLATLVASRKDQS